MDNNDADTITPLDVPETEGDESPFGFGNVSEDEYETRGRTTVATRRGFRFVPKDESLPVIHSGGVKVTREQAEALVAESKGTRAEVRILDDEEGE